MKEFMLSLSGTIIIKTGDKNETKHLPSLATDTVLIKARLYGGDANSYSCTDKEDCLNTREAKVSIDEKNSFTAMVLKTLSNIRHKIIDDKALSKEEINFLGSTSIPIYKIMNVEYAHNFASTAINLDAYADLIAYDFMTQYLNEIVDVVMRESQAMEIGGDYIKELRSGILTAKQGLNDALKAKNQNFAMINDLVRRTHFMDQVLAGKLSSSIVTAIGFENGA